MINPISVRYYNKILNVQFLIQFLTLIPGVWRIPERNSFRNSGILWHFLENFLFKNSGNPWGIDKNFAEIRWINDDSCNILVEMTYDCNILHSSWYILHNFYVKMLFQIKYTSNLNNLENRMHHFTVICISFYTLDSVNIITLCLNIVW